MMKPKADQLKAPESKPTAKEEPQSRLTEDESNKIEDKKVNPFRNFLNHL
jgi:hypothetical protein